MTNKIITSIQETLADGYMGFIILFSIIINFAVIIAYLQPQFEVIREILINLTFSLILAKISLFLTAFFYHLSKKI